MRLNSLNSKLLHTWIRQTHQMMAAEPYHTRDLYTVHGRREGEPAWGEWWSLRGSRDGQQKIQITFSNPSDASFVTVSYLDRRTGRGTDSAIFRNGQRLIIEVLKMQDLHVRKKSMLPCPINVTMLPVGHTWAWLIKIAQALAYWYSQNYSLYWRSSSFCF